MDGHPKFQIEVLTWFAGLTRLARVDPRDLVVHVVDGQGSSATAWLETQGVSVREIEAFDPRDVYANPVSGALSLAHAGVEGMVVLAETDVVSCEDLRDLPVPPSAIAMAVVSRENPPFEVLERVFAAAELDLPPLCSPLLEPTKRTVVLNGNGGVYVLHADLLAPLSAAWARWTTWLLDRRAELDLPANAAIAQVAMALALAAEHLGVLQLEPRWNFRTPNARLLLHADDSPAVLHYHRALDPHGHLRLTGVPWVDRQIRVANRAIADVLDRAISDDLRQEFYRARKSTELHERRYAEVKRAIEDHVPKRASVIVIDEMEWSLARTIHRRPASRFMERCGQFWGHPSDSEHAVAELERARESGRGFLVIGWPAFWWLEHYEGFTAHLQSNTAVVFENEDVRIFNLAP